ncbi:hypothetical protein BDR22DRAFT_894086 [Usnea florida]
MHAQNILAFFALAVVAMSAAIPAAVPEPHAEIVRKGEASADAVDIAQIGDGY